MHPTKAEYRKLVRTKASEIESGKWRAAVGNAILQTIGGVGLLVAMGDWHTLGDNRLKFAMVCAGLLAVGLWNMWRSILNAPYRLHCDLLDKVESLEVENRNLAKAQEAATPARPATPTFVRRIMENFAHHGIRITMAGDSALYDVWAETSGAFVRRAFVTAWRDSFFWITAENSTVMIVRDDKTREIKQTSNMISARASWLEDGAKEIQESHIAYGCTEADLLEWIDWTPPSSNSGIGVATSVHASKPSAPATPVDVRRIMEHFAHVGTGLEGARASQWRTVALEFARHTLTPRAIVDFEMPELPQWQYSNWLGMRAPLIEESDINRGVTIGQLKQWENYQPA